MMNNIFEITIKKPLMVLLFFILITVVLSFGLAKLTSDPDFDKFLPENHSVRKFNNQIKNTFSLGKSIFIVVENKEPEGIFNKESLTIIHSITEKVASIEGVLANTIMSIATERNIVGTEQGMTADFFMEEVPASKELIKNLKKDVLSSELYIGNIVSSDGTMGSIMFDVEDNIDNLKMHDTIKALIENYMNEKNSIYVTGDPIASGLIGKYIGMDMAIMMPIASFVVLFMLWITYRNFKAMCLPFIVISASVVWTMGIQGLTGIPMNMISPIIPIILMAIGDTDSIHIIAVYYRKMIESDGRDRDESLRETFREVVKPLIFTSLTTGVGFLSLVTSPIDQIKHFGIFTAIGVISAMFMSIFLIPALIVLWKMDVPHSFIKRFKETKKYSKMEEIFSFLGESLYSRKKLIILVLCIIFIISSLGISKIQVDDVLIENFKKSTDIYKATKLVNAKFNGTSILNFVLQPVKAEDDESFFQKPENLRAVEDLQIWAERDGALVGNTLAITDFLKKIRSAMNNNDPEFKSIPLTEEEAAQYLFLYGLSGQPEDFEKYATIDFSKVNVFAYMKEPHYRDSKIFIDGLFNYFNEQGYNKTMKLDMAGQGALGMARVAVVIDTLQNSLIYSMIGIFIICSFMFRSLVAGLLNVLTVGISLLINFGIMGFLGIDIAVGTSIISSIIIGIGVDFSIHILSKYILIIKSEPSLLKATGKVLETLGATLFISAMVIVLGFIVLLASQVPPTVTVGALVSLAMFCSFISSVIFLPVLILIMKPSFIVRRINV